MEYKYNLFLVKITALREFNNSMSSNMKVSFEILLPEETGKITMAVSEIRQEETKKNNTK